MKKFCIMLVILFQLIGLSASESTLAIQEMTKDFLKTNVIAGVVGYETERVVGNNLHVAMFSTTPEAGNGEEKGILFQVVAPSNHATKFFWMHHDGLMSSGKSFELYPPNLLYSFRFNTDTNDIGSITEANLFQISVKGKSLCTLRPPGIPFFTSTNEVNCEIVKIDSEVNLVSNRLVEARLRLENLDNSSKEFKRCFGVIRYCEGFLASAAKQKQALNEKNNDVERNAAFISIITEKAHGEKGKNIAPKHENYQESAEQPERKRHERHAGDLRL